MRNLRRKRPKERERWSPGRLRGLGSPPRWGRASIYEAGARVDALGSSIIPSIHLPLPPLRSRSRGHPPVTYTWEVVLVVICMYIRAGCMRIRGVRARGLCLLVDLRCLWRG